MSLEQTACEDLKAFERRLTEVITCLQPAAIRWRIVLMAVSLCTVISAWYWLIDPAISTISFSESLWRHLFFTISISILVILFLFGIHKRVMAPSIIASRTRLVLSDFNMSCDETGKLILKPRPTVT
ncbi:UNVERIFIED_CONTAM: hypothetical protein PYX00_007965 [Menopon gallinae]|uniref:Transmembrane protein 188 n=2 Tax=Menopon gallinae TaxID=328185 RepID=A0AAW2HLE1_9NEOP